ncbi:MAG: TlpA family protein disulfide reductase [Acidimicrobiia bacterium]
MSNTSKARPKDPRHPAPRSRRGFPVWPVLIAAIVIAGIVAVVATSGGGDDTEVVIGPDGDPVAQTAPVTITGDPLPQFESTADDPAIGEKAPTLQGSNFSGDAVTIPADDGNAKAIFFVAHWCPHCQDEIPRLAEWLATHDLPSGVDLELVSTRVNAAPDNYPPSEWLEREGVGDIPVIADDEDSSAYAAYGAGGLPYIVYLDGNGDVVLRTEGEYGDDPEVYTDLLARLAAGETLDDPRTAG